MKSKIPFLAGSVLLMVIATDNVQGAPRQTRLTLRAPEEMRQIDTGDAVAIVRGGFRVAEGFVVDKAGDGLSFLFDLVDCVADYDGVHGFDSVEVLEPRTDEHRKAAADLERRDIDQTGTSLEKRQELLGGEAPEGETDEAYRLRVTAARNKMPGAATPMDPTTRTEATTADKTETHSAAPSIASSYIPPARATEDEPLPPHDADAMVTSLPSQPSSETLSTLFKDIDEDPPRQPAAFTGDYYYPPPSTPETKPEGS